MEIFKILGTVAIDGAEKAKSALDGVAGVASKAGKVIAAGLAVGATAVGALTKEAVASYAEYEQLVGGVETLFKDSAGIVQDYADRAYETAGLSANEYMETVTSFSASLLQSLGGDTAKATETADRAITDMADNANKMGSDISMIQNAYQGFAKQNYTMLDNLKLGYGGTKEEMARLLKDAQKLSGQKFDLSSYADIVDAIHVIQTEMGITGTTAAEASSTISGSIASMKAQWQNLMTAFAGDGWDVGVYIRNFVDSATTAVRNIVPRLAQILSGISEAMTQIMPIVAAELPGILQQLLPGLITGATALVTGLVQSLPIILQILIAELPNIVAQISAGLVSTFPALLATVKDLFGQIWNYISVELLNTGVEFDTALNKASVLFSNLWKELQSVWASIGQPVWDLIQDCIGIVRDVFSEYMPEIQEFVSTCFTDIQDFWNDNLKPCFDAIGDFIENTLAPVFKDVFESKIKTAVGNAFSFIKDVWNNTLKPVFTGITDFLTGVFTNDWEQAFEGLGSIVDGVFSGIKRTVRAAINQVIDIINNMIEGINELEIPDWVPGVGGESLDIPLIPKLAKGGILEKGQLGFLEGTGAEAVVPLDQNRAWISKVADDMNTAIGGDNQHTQKIIDLLQTLIDILPETMVEAFKSMKFDVNNREFARLVKAVG